MSKQVINNGETGLSVRTKLNENFTELYTGAETVAATEKATPVDADVVPIQDSAASFIKKKVTWANIKATLKSYFDTLYSTIASATQIAGVNNQVGTTYTLVLSDAGKIVRCANVAAVTVTVPPNSDVAIPVNTTLTIEQSDVGVVTAAEGVGVTLNALDSGLSTMGQYAVITLIKVDTDVWTVIGGTV